MDWDDCDDCDSSHEASYSTNESEERIEQVSEKAWLEDRENHRRHIELVRAADAENEWKRREQEIRRQLGNSFYETVVICTLFAAVCLCVGFCYGMHTFYGVK